MRRQSRRDGGPPPPQPFPPTFEFAPEPAYFQETNGFPTLEAGKATARLVARWATRYLARPVGPDAPVREGVLPRGARDREAIVDEIFEWEGAWLQDQRVVLPQFVGLYLYRGTQLLLDQHDGIPAHRLHLTMEQFDGLRDGLARHTLPRDLYFPLNELRFAQAPIEYFGGVVLGERSYSPLQWARRAETPALPLPTETERKAVMLQAASRFSDALAAYGRMAREQRRGSDPLDLETLVSLERALGRLRDRYVDRDPHGNVVARESISLPPRSWEEERSAFLAESARFTQDLARRCGELGEPGGVRDQSESDLLDDVGRMLAPIRARAYRE